jgi:hypothetical protein
VREGLFEADDGETALVFDRIAHALTGQTAGEVAGEVAGKVADRLPVGSPGMVVI